MEKGEALRKFETFPGVIHTEHGRGGVHFGTLVGDFRRRYRRTAGFLKNRETLMLKRLLQRRRARTNAPSTRLANPECLETRAMLTASPIGDAILVSDLFAGPQRSEITSIEALVSGEQGSTVVFHGQGVSDVRLPGNDREIFFQQFESSLSTGAIETVNQITRGEQFQPKADMATDGSFWVVWSGRGEGDRDGVFARRFGADGAALTDQVRVNTTRGGVQGQADIGVASDGTAVVVWTGVGDGDFDGVFMQRLAADGTLVGTETLVNQTTEDMQTHPVVAVNQDGSFVVSWSSRHQDRAGGWGIFARIYDDSATPIDDEFQVNVQTEGSQHLPAIDIADSGDFVITWSSLGQDTDGWGVFGRQFSATGAPGGETQISGDDVGNQRNSSVGVASAGEFVIAWIEGEESGSGWEVVARSFNSDGQVDGDQFTVNPTADDQASDHQTTPSVALNGLGNSLIAFEGNGANDRNGVFAQSYEVDVAPPENVRPVIEQVNDSTAIVGRNLQIVINATDENRLDELTYSLEVNGQSDELRGAVLQENEIGTATLFWTPSVDDRGQTVTFRVIATDNGDPPLAEAIQFDIDVLNAAPVVTLNGDEEITLSASESVVSITSSRLTIADDDQTELSGATITISSSPDADESLSVDTSGTAITASFNEASNVLTLTGTDTITNYEQVLQTLTYSNSSATRSAGIRQILLTVTDGADTSDQATIRVRVVGENTAPAFSIGDQALFSGSPLNVAIDAFDLDGDNLTYTVTSSDPSLVSADIRTGNRSWQLEIDSPENGISNGTMIFELFEDLAPRATERFITLTNEGFYDGLIFHRVINQFVIQGGDPLGTGTGGSDLGDFDDQFHVDLQHNTTGLLSMAKSVDDTNDSQFFVTEGPTRNLDGNHTIFGVLTEGELIRETISNVPTNGSDRPNNDVTIANAQIIVDNVNGTLVLSSPEGSSGTAEITVTASDGTSTFTETFTVTVTPDVVNTRPWLGDIPVIETAIDTPVTHQLVGIDVEGDEVQFFGPAESAASSGGFPVLQPPAGLDVSVDSTTGLMTITPSNGSSGTFEVTVGASNSGSSTINDFQTFEIRIG